MEKKTKFRSNYYYADWSKGARSRADKMYQASPTWKGCLCFTVKLIGASVTMM